MSGGGHDKVVSACEQIRTHEDWIRAKYGPRIPPRYNPYINNNGSIGSNTDGTTTLSREVKTSDTMSETISAKNIAKYLEGLGEENELLKTVINEQEEIIRRLKKQIGQAVSVLQQL